METDWIVAFNFFTDHKIMTHELGPQTFTTCMEVFNYLKANPANRLRDSEGDVIYAVVHHNYTEYRIEGSEERLQLKSDQGPWVEVFPSILDEDITEEPRFQEPGPEDLHYEATPIEFKSDPYWEQRQAYNDAQRALYENTYEPVEFDNIHKACIWLIQNPGREVEDKNQLRIYFDSGNDGHYTFRYGAGAIITITPGAGPWKVVPSKESAVRKHTAALMEQLHCTSESDRITIHKFLFDLVKSH